MKVIFLGCTTSYGFGFSANITKIGYMAKGLVEAGADCAIHNGILGLSEINENQTKTVDNLPVTTFKKRGNPFCSFFLNIRNLYLYLKREHKKGESNIVVTTLSLYHILIAYYLISKMAGYKFVAISHEWGPCLKGNNKIKYWLYCLYAKTFGWYTDGILPISEYIIERIKHFKKPFFKVPVLAEFNEHRLNTDVY